MGHRSTVRILLPVDAPDDEARTGQAGSDSGSVGVPEAEDVGPGSGGSVAISEGSVAHRRLRRDLPDLPVLLMSGYATDALNAEGIAEDSIEILATPFFETELLERVAAVLDGARGRA